MNDDYTPKFNVTIEDYHRETLTLFGPTFILPGAGHSGSGTNEYRAAVARMISQRCPEEGGAIKSQRLSQNQWTIRRVYRNQLHRFKAHFEEHIVREHAEDSYARWLNTAHPKKKLRMKANEDWFHNGVFLDDDGHVDYKLKKYERLEAGKKRGTADLNVYRTQYTAHALEAIKMAWSVPFEHNRLRAVYVKSADTESLTEAFQRLVFPEPGRIEFYYHSDDSCVAAVCSDGVVQFNGDIKSCDGSHRTPLFELLRDILTRTGGLDNEHTYGLSLAFDFLKLPLRMVNQRNRKEKVKYEFTTTRLYSGSVLTTTVNNFANLLISFALERRVPNPSVVTREEFMQAYVLAGEDVGYLLKTQVCTTPADLQFLKHFPYVHGSTVYPVMGLGVWLRGFGLFKGDLPGRGPIRARARAFNSDVIRGRVGWGQHLMSDAFANKVIEHDIRFTGDAYRAAVSYKTTGTSSVRVPNATLCERYHCREDELEYICELIANADVGSVVCHPTIDQIYMVDYG